MVQVGFGMSQGPNGPQMGPVLMFTPVAEPAPTSYENYFETPEGISVRLTYFTDNKVTADRLSDEAIQRLGWKVLDSAPQTPESLLSKLGSAWATALMVPIILGAIAIMLAFALDVAGYIEFRQADQVLTNSVKYGLWAFPVLGLLLSAVAIFTHSSGNSNA